MMKSRILTGFFLLSSITQLAMGQINKDVFKTNKGDLEIWFIGHGSLMFNYNGKNIHVDPFSRMADYSTLPKADLILITHEHGDHLDQNAINAIQKDDTRFIVNITAGEILKKGQVMKNNEKVTVQDLIIESVPAYNILHKRENGNPYHPKGSGNGYVITFGDKRVYVAGDTENIPEMGNLKNIDIAFLPMNLPYTMTPEMTADAAKMFMPKILYPYHYSKTDTNLLVELLKDTKKIEVRIRKM